LVISYQANQLMDPQLWDSYFCSISLSEIDKYLARNIKNIICLLLRMTVFIKQWSLDNRITKNILQIAKFGFVACEFLLAIYKSRWDKLIANNENKTFRQCVLSQFNKTSTKNTTTIKLLKGKQANVLKILLSIPSRPSKSVLANSKRTNPWNWTLTLTTSLIYRCLKWDHQDQGHISKTVL